MRLGEYDFESTEETRALDFSIVEISIHPDFDTATYENDIAMIKMHRPTIFDSYIWPVCLPPIGQSFENESAIVTGWGTQYYGGPASTVLMEVGVPVWPRDRCTRSFVQRIPNTTICAGSYEGGGDSCQVKKYRLSVQKITKHTSLSSICFNEVIFVLFFPSHRVIRVGRYCINLKTVDG